MHCPFLFHWIAWHQSFTHRSVVINPLCEVDKTSLGVQFSVLIHQTVAQLAPIHVFLPYCLLSHLISEIKGDISQLIPRPKNFITSNSILFSCKIRDEKHRKLLSLIVKPFNTWVQIVLIHKGRPHLQSM